MIKIMDKAEWRRRAVEHGAELAKVKQQLAIAVEALEKYADKRNWSNDSLAEDCMYIKDNGYKESQIALQQIKELGK